MFQIIAHAKPLPETEMYDKCIGAYVIIFIDYQDIDGAFTLAKYYIEANNWELEELEEEYFVVECEDDLDQDYRQYYPEAIEYGFCMIFNTYKQE